MPITRKSVRRLEDSLKNAMGDNDVKYELEFLSRDCMQSVIKVVRNEHVVGKIDPKSAEGRRLLRRNMVELPEFIVDI